MAASGITPAPVISSSPVSVEPVADGALTILSILALVASLISLGLVFMAYSGAAAS